MQVERTLVLIKPDGVGRNLVVRIIDRIEDIGLLIVRYRRVVATRKHIEKHLPTGEAGRAWTIFLGEKNLESYDEAGIDPSSLHGETTDAYAVGCAIRETIFEYLMSGSVVVMEVEGENAIARVRALVGHTLPWRAEKGTIRGDFSLGKLCESVPGKACINIVHSSDSTESAQREIRAWFSN